MTLKIIFNKRVQLFLLSLLFLSKLSSQQIAPPAPEGGESRNTLLPLERGEEILIEMEKRLSLVESKFSGYITRTLNSGSRIRFKFNRWSSEDEYILFQIHDLEGETPALLRLGVNLFSYSRKERGLSSFNGLQLENSYLGNISYEDLVERNRLSKDFDVLEVREEEFEGEEVWVITILAKWVTLPYQGRTLWVRKSDYLPIKREYYNNQGRLLKEITIKREETVHDKNIPTEILYIDYLIDERPTIMTILSYQNTIPRDDSVSFNLMDLQELKF